MQYTGQKLIAARPKELTVGNVVRRVLSLIREEAEENRDQDATGYSDNASEGPSQPSGAEENSQAALPPTEPFGPGSLRQDGSSPTSLAEVDAVGQQPTSNTAPTTTSMFNLLSHPLPNQVPSAATLGNQLLGRQSPLSTHALINLNTAKDLRAEVLEGIEELLDELRQADDQIAGYALEQIHSSEIILTNSPSKRIQRFLLKAATKRKFTVIHVEAYPNDNEDTYEAIVGKQKPNNKSFDPFTKSLTTTGVTVIVVPDSAVFALMARVNKVILDTHIVLANGGLVASSGTNLIVKAARAYRAPVLVLSAVYQLSPVHPFDPDTLLEFGDPDSVMPYEDGDFHDKVKVQNPLHDYISASLVDLYITNLGGHTPSSLHRLVSDHYRAEDIK